MDKWTRGSIGGPKEGEGVLRKYHVTIYINDSLITYAIQSDRLAACPALSITYVGDRGKNGVPAEDVTGCQLWLLVCAILRNPPFHHT